MNIIIPMAGLGSRFTQAGFRLPKPLINIGNIPMYQVAVNSLPLHLATQLIFIIRESEYSKKLEHHIKTTYKNTFECHIVLLKQETEGQAETVLKSSSLINKNISTLVHNCDTEIENTIDWQAMFMPKIEGGLVLFHSNEQRWSYAKLNEDNTKVVEVQEKKIISAYASSGTYYFADTAYLMHNINYMITNQLKHNNEYYFSMVYQLMIKDKKVVVPIWSQKIWCYGTPEDLVNSLNEKLIFPRSKDVRRQPDIYCSSRPYYCQE